MSYHYSKWLTRNVSFLESSWKFYTLLASVFFKTFVQCGVSFKFFYFDFSFARTLKMCLIISLEWEMSGQIYVLRFNLISAWKICNCQVKSCYFLDRRSITNQFNIRVSQIDELMLLCEGLSPAVAIVEFPFTFY